MNRIHLDTDFLVHAVMRAGSERQQLLKLVESPAIIEMSGVAWYEFARGPRTPEELALASMVLEDDDIVAFSGEIATTAAETFRRMRGPRRRASDVAIGTTAALLGATLWTSNTRDFAGIPDLVLGPQT